MVILPSPKGVWPLFPIILTPALILEREMKFKTASFFLPYSNWFMDVICIAFCCILIKTNLLSGDIYDNNEQLDEEMTVELDLDDGTTVVCSIITILEVEDKDYIVLLPLDENGENEDGEVWFYRYSENPDDPNEEPVLDFIDSDEEYEAVADAFDEYLDSMEFDEIIEEES